ncbi:hypothetical protein EON83_17780 [bacterium]|nr:MAG: hypothetical protein EON83_17780 [bacterium]
MRLLPYALSLALTVFSVAVPAFSQNSIQVGELRLEGRVVMIEPGRITITANAFVNSSGKRGQIEPPKTKVVLLPTQDTLPDLKVGESIVATGRDGGTGQPLIAREVTRLQAEGTIQNTPPTTPQQAVNPAQANNVLEFKGGLTPGWKAGALDVRVEKAGFDYTTRFLPSSIGTLDKTPVFYSIFQIRGLAAQNEVKRRLIIRRLLGPHSEYVKPSGLNVAELRAKDGAARVVFWSAQIDPTWEFADMDIDTNFNEKLADWQGAEMVFDTLPLPKEGEVALQKEAISSFGTRYKALKIKKFRGGDWQLVVSHERPEKPLDLEITGFSYQAGVTSGVGGLFNRNAMRAEHELLLSQPATATEVKNIVFRFNELSRSMAKRDSITRRRVRFPLSDLLQQAPPAPLDTSETVLAQATEGPVTAQLESQGLRWGQDNAGALLFMKATPSDAKRGVQWTIQKGTQTQPGQQDGKNIHMLEPNFNALWHADATPKTAAENVQGMLLQVNPNNPKADTEFQLEGRPVLTTFFERSIEIPLKVGEVEAQDDGEGTLILRKVHRFARPEELKKYSNTLRSNWPSSGIALLFEANPLLGDAAFTPLCVEAEDDLGRSLQISSQYKGIMDRVDGNGAGAMYLLGLGEPAPDAKSIKIWFSTEEKGNSIRKQTIRLKDVPLILPK